jgi:predicted ribosome quality control (RQC) complex YloA/Tae2 family protein
MPGAVHKIPDLWKDDTIIRVLAQQIMRKRKLEEQAEEKEKEKQRKLEEKKQRMLNQAQSLQDVSNELDEMEKKLEKLREEKHLLFNELKKVSREEDERRQRDASNQQMINNWSESRKPTSSYGAISEGDGRGRISIMNSHKSIFNPSEMPMPTYSPATPRAKCPSSPAVNPYLRPNTSIMAGQNRYLKMPQSPASPALNK